ncbi:MAG TPA: class I SAM-dependent methyltransferase [Acidimicrobiia bacterium]|nr:class I SAM-dependent methyltransferase [Acidimicrobiia bacterium]
MSVVTLTTADPIALPGGDQGAQRLAVLGRLKLPTTMALLEGLGLNAGMRCLDVGCGSGAITLAMASVVGPTGRVVGFDHNKAVLRWAVDAAHRERVPQVTFCTADVSDLDAEACYDLVFARFLLSRVPNPGDALDRMVRALRPGGIVVVEDEEFAGQFCHPHSDAFDRFAELYAAALRRRGGDPEIGPELPARLDAYGLEGVGVNVVQPTFRRGEGKRLPALTMAHLGPELEAHHLADVDEVDDVTADLQQLAHDDTSIVGLPRVYQCWGRRPA